MTTFGSIIDSPAGVRYMYQRLPLRSGAGRRMVLEGVMMTGRGEVEAEYGCLREFYDLLAAGSVTEHPLVTRLQARLDVLKDIRGTLDRLTRGEALLPTELFEVKALAILAGEVAALLGEAGVVAVAVPDLSAVLAILDPDGQRVASFYLYDSYSEELRALRAKVRAAGEEAPAELVGRLQEIEQQICAALSVELGGHHGALSRALEALARTDVLLAKALQMRDMGLCFPTISGGPDGSTIPTVAITRYRAVWHPMVAERLANVGREFQPVDISFGGEPTTVIGANMGGKTVVLKMVALCQYLCQFGFGVPASAAEIDIKEGVALYIGDEEDSARGLSSFGGEVVRIDGMIAAARRGERLLALVDEPARSTNPTEGTALVESLLDVMSGLATDLVITTHYDLKGTPGRMLRVKGLRNGVMDYALEATSGPAPREALAIAESLGADAQWLDGARRRMEK